MDRKSVNRRRRELIFNYSERTDQTEHNSSSPNDNLNERVDLEIILFGLKRTGESNDSERGRRGKSEFSLVDSVEAGKPPKSVKSLSSAVLRPVESDGQVNNEEGSSNDINDTSKTKLISLSKRNVPESNLLEQMERQYKSGGGVSSDFASLPAADDDHTDYMDYF